MKIRKIKPRQVLLPAGIIALCLGLTPITSSFTFQIQSGERRTVADGEKLKFQGVVLRRDGEVILVRDNQRQDTVVLLTDETSIKTSKKGVLRGGKTQGVTSIIQGLVVTVEGKGDAEGRLVADDIRFKDEDLRAAITASVRVSPVEQQAEANKQNIDANKQNIAANKQGIDDTNTRISELDDWELAKTVTVYFAVNSTTLSSEAKATLDEIGPRANVVKNYKVEVQGFADSTGNAERNLALSQSRADKVVQYLTVKYNVPLRRISTPMGYGATQAEGATADTRTKDRRVDIRILVNKAAR